MTIIDEAGSTDDRTLPVDVQMQLRKEAEDIARRVSAPQGSFIKITQDKKFHTPDGQTNAGPIDVVIVDFASANYYYPGPYNPATVENPVCFAIGPAEATLVPSMKSSDRQSDTCVACAQNQWGSAGRGNAKACKNSRVLAVIKPGDGPEDPILLLRVSPTAIRAFDGYVSTLARDSKYGPPVTAISQIGFDPGTTYATLRFGKPVPNPDVNGAYARRAEAQMLLASEPDFNRTKTEAATPQAPAPVTPPTIPPLPGGRAGVISRVRR